jgi:hypothetical protein
MIHSAHPADFLGHPRNPKVQRARSCSRRFIHDDGTDPGHKPLRECLVSCVDRVGPADYHRRVFISSLQTRPHPGATRETMGVICACLRRRVGQLASTASDLLHLLKYSSRGRALIVYRCRRAHSSQLCECGTLACSSPVARCIKAVISLCSHGTLRAQGA